MLEKLTLIRNECLFNSYIMYCGIRRIKQENYKSNKKSYWINTSVVVATLLSLFFATLKIEQLACKDQVSFVFTLLAFGLSIAIFLFRENKDTKINYNIANSYWLLHKRIQDLIFLAKNNDCNLLDQNINSHICQEFEIIKNQMDLLVRFSPVFQQSDIDEAKQLISTSNTFLYFNENELNDIKNFFARN